MEQGTPIELAAGQEARNINVALPRGGDLTGLLFDPFGDPVTGATVRALRFRYTSGTCRPPLGTPPGVADSHSRARRPRYHRRADRLPHAHPDHRCADRVDQSPHDPDRSRRRFARTASDGLHRRHLRGGRGATNAGRSRSGGSHRHATSGWPRSPFQRVPGPIRSFSNGSFPTPSASRLVPAKIFGSRSEFACFAKPPRRVVQH